MIARDMTELDTIRSECMDLVTKRALVSGATSSIPVPGVDVAADVLILMELLQSINARFGLSSEQIDGYDPVTKQVIYQLIKRAGLTMVGAEVSKTLVTQVLKRAAGKTVARQAFKFVPILGSVVNAAIGFTAMKYVGNTHVEDCHAVCRKIIEMNGVDGSSGNQ